MKLNGVNKRFLLSLGALFSLLAAVVTHGAESSSTTVHMARPMPADEAPGARPYEMVRANRRRRTHRWSISTRSKLASRV
jgi:hypothetical protein